MLVRISEKSDGQFLKHISFSIFVKNETDVVVETTFLKIKGTDIVPSPILVIAMRS
jgi:hypothetical protein